MYFKICLNLSIYDLWLNPRYPPTCPSPPSGRFLEQERCMYRSSEIKLAEDGHLQPVSSHCFRTYGESPHALMIMMELKVSNAQDTLGILKTASSWFFGALHSSPTPQMCINQTFWHNKTYDIWFCCAERFD